MMQETADTTQQARPVENVRPIRTPADHRWALAEVDRYFTQEPAVGTPDGDRFEVLLTLIAAYEDQNFPIAAADPVEILHFAITDMGRSQSELAHLLGSRARASEILNRKRALSLGQIRAISAAWNLPIALLAAPYRLEDDAA
ncbi:MULTISPECIES: XRE family transcriptional regulator [unclassified Methylobacterium]|uniref:helix-turn-helix domain-containing protein n=1 Tax=unclassified Methylobacterium TaxID=2615210 RepID=UPI001FBB1AB2|nr:MULTISPECIES: XRE family transcriptional regulator [unclassified Methylobacterium]MCJ2017454.1 XRE family transcriptional regulator [Methylobacterium sp. E-065]